MSVFRVQIYCRFDFQKKNIKRETSVIIGQLTLIIKNDIYLLSEV